MRQLLFTLIIILFTTSAFAQANKTFVKSFNLQGNHAVVLELEGKVEIKEWADPIVRVLTNIEIDNTNDNTLKALIAAGRYKISSNLIGGALVLTSTSRDQEVKVRGQVLNENVSYTIFVPQKVNVEVKDSGTHTEITVGQVSSNSR